MLQVIPVKVSQRLDNRSLSQNWRLMQAAGALLVVRRVRGHPHADRDGRRTIVESRREGDYKWLSRVEGNAAGCETAKLAEQLTVYVYLVGVVDQFRHLQRQRALPVLDIYP